MPPKYGDFSKCVSDILSDDYGAKKVVKSKFTTESVYGGAINFTMETTMKPSADPALFGKLSAKWKHKASGINVDKLALNTDGSSNLELSASKLPVPGVNLKCAAKSNKFGDITAEYTNDMIYSILKVSDKLKATCSVVAASSGLMAGAQLSAADGKVSSYEMALGYKAGSYFGSIRAFDSLNKLSLAGMYKVPSQPLKIAACMDAESAGMKIGDASLGVDYKVNDKATVKAKYVSGNSSAVETAMVYKCLSKVDMVLSLALPIQSPSEKYKTGLTLTLG